ncbi:unnamed protein product [Parascedosporium putredinis]|uniref:Nudix hydrolase domain-containing protein n=1 Tax=Parascedosporium putredinis TaxID=1442378 RepID=A0A9P1HDK0_9PEZI|nr:unnamed protein product [Parascedosporium putredinis]CAI8004900.1 unnamed protein product [Parascedosporium putredinis]
MENTIAGLTRRHVVSCFIFKGLAPSSAEPPRVALFRRSSKVRTYQHRLAPISGSVEKSDATPLDAAWRELQEETTLNSRSLQLRRQGKQYSFIDEALKREWVIFPFAFDLVPLEKGGKGEAGIKIDWEHQEWQWHNPREVTDSDEFGGVPTSRPVSAVPGWSMTLTIATLSVEVQDQAQWWRQARMIAWNIWKNGRESMGAAILNVLISSLKRLESLVLPKWDEMQSVERGKLIEKVLADYTEQRQGVNGDISNAFNTLIAETETRVADRPIRILTLSASSIIARCLVDAIVSTKHSFDIRILESRPLFEGLARSTTRRYSPESADIISANGDTCNKIGSLPAVLSTKHVSPGAKVIVVADREKLYPFEPPPREENDRGEVTESWKYAESTATAEEAIVSSELDAPSIGNVKNLYFEWVEAGFIDHYLFEDGLKTATDVQRLASVVEGDASRYFDDL